MFKDQYIDRYAQVLLWGLKTARKERRKKSDIILIRHDLAAFPLAERLFEKLLKAGRHPLVKLMATCPMGKKFYEISSHRQPTFMAPGETELLKNLRGIFPYRPAVFKNR